MGKNGDVVKGSKIKLQKLLSLILRIALFALLPHYTLAQLPGLSFWKKHNSKLAITTSAQSLLASNCSGALTIQSQNWLGTALNVGSNLTVNLSNTGTVTFYSDSYCTSTTTTATITTGTNSASVYFISATTGSPILTAAAVGYISASQSETISTNPYIWTGGGGDGNWSTGANWSGGAGPGASNIAVFDGTCISNCSATINANISIGGIRMAAGYTGTITQAAGITISVGSNGWTQIAGTFMGGNSSITLNGPFNLAGGTFTSTSGTLYESSTAWIISGSPTFNHNSGTLYFSANCSIVPGLATYHHVTFYGAAKTFNLSGGTLTMDGDLLLNNISAGGSIDYINTGTILVSGNVSSIGASVGFQGSAIIQLSGNATGQTVSSNSPVNTIPNLTIAAGTNPVTLGSTVAVYGNYTMTSVGTFNTAASTLVFTNSATIIPGNFGYNNVTFGVITGGGYVYNLAGGTLTVNGNLILNNNTGGGTANSINSGTIVVYGDLTSTGSGGSGYTGSVTIQLAGNVAGQTVNSNAVANTIPNLVVAAGTNPVTFGSIVALVNGFTMTSVGTFTSASSTLYLANALTFSPGTAIYGNVSFSSCASYSLNNGTLNIGGNLTFANPCGSALITVNSGTLNLTGNLSKTGTPGVNGNVQLAFVGSSNQTVTVSGGTSLPTGNVTVNTSNGATLTLGSAVSWNNAGQTLTVTAGAINMSGFALTAKALSLNATTITKGGGTLTVNGVVAGSGSLYGGTVNP